ncbi:hypothetical protein X975_08411, partial [Stegodyphus mimosarum]
MHAFKDTDCILLSLETVVVKQHLNNVVIIFLRIHFASFTSLLKTGIQRNNRRNYIS